MMVNVTQPDIDKGLKGMTACCPIALAVKRQHPCQKCFVYGFTLEIFYPDTGVSNFYKLPEEAGLFIANFDSGSKVNPFHFKVTLIQFRNLNQEIMRHERLQHSLH